MKKRGKAGSVVAVAGGFDPLHYGHVRHIQAASKLGDQLVVIVNPDCDMIRKKGYCFMPLAQRMEIMIALKGVDKVVEAIDGDGTVAETLRMIKPDVLAKGGDRTPNTMPVNEIKACDEIGCEIIYNVGGDKIASSSELMRR